MLVEGLCRERDRPIGVRRDIRKRCAGRCHQPAIDRCGAASKQRRADPARADLVDVLPEQVKRCLDAGMDGHIGKPISPAELLETIAAWTGGTEEATARRALAGARL